jgi:hypothetical protein
MARALKGPDRDLEFAGKTASFSFDQGDPGIESSTVLLVLLAHLLPSFKSLIQNKPHC